MRPTDPKQKQDSSARGSVRTMRTSKRTAKRPMRIVAAALLVLLPVAALLTVCSERGSAPNGASDTPVATEPSGVASYSATVVETYPHDRGAYTEGLLFHNGELYESTGLEGHSSIRKVDYRTGGVIRKIDVDSQYFGEGIVILKDKLYELTWKAQKGFVYDLATFKKLGEFKYTGEGWGMTTDGTSLIMTDGTSRIRFIDPRDFKVTRTIEVVDGGRPVQQLNELEWVKGELLANVWQTDQIARIDPATGKVTGWIDLTGLLTPEDKQGGQVDVLNGIAYDSTSDRLFVTGKWWPKLYEIQLKRRG
jgi:glutamine cyclotransferase